MVNPFDPIIKKILRALRNLSGRVYTLEQGGGSGTLTDGDYGDVTVSGTGTVITLDSAIDAIKIADGSVSSTEFQYINSLSSNAQTQISAKQDVLISGTNIKTINSTSLLGSGNLSIIATESDPVWLADKPSYLTTAIAASTYQPVDSDLTTISGLTATTNNFLVSVSSAWASRTPAQVKTTLSLDNIENAAASTLYLPLLGGSITGTAGSGFIGLIPQSSAPGTPVSGVRVYARSTGALSWKGTNGFERSFVGTGLTADHSYTLPDADGTLAILASPAFTGTPTAPTASPGTITTQLATTGFVQQAISAGSIPTRTGTVIAFDIVSVYNTYASPGTGNITFDFTGAVVNTEVVLIHNGSAPTFPSQAVIVGTYYPANNNEIHLIYRSGTEVDVRIINSNTSNYTNPQRFGYLSSDVATTGQVAIDLTAMALSVDANSKYEFECILLNSCSSTGGVKTGFASITSATVTYDRLYTSSGATTTAFAISNAFGVSSVAHTTYAGTGEIVFRGIVNTGASSGTFTPQFFATTSGQTATIIAAYSKLRLTKIA